MELIRLQFFMSPPSRWNSNFSKRSPPQTVSSYGINRVKSLKWSLQIDPIYSKRNILKRPSLFSFVNFNPPLLYIPSHVKSSLISVSIPHYNHRPTSDPMLISLFPLYDYYYCSVYSFCIFYRPGLTIPRDLKYAFFSVGTTEFIHVNIGYYERRSKPAPLLIRVSPFYANFNLSVYYLVILSPVIKYSA